MAAIGPNQPTPQDPTSIHQSPGTTNAQQTIGKEVEEGRMLSVKERAKAIEQAVNQGPIGHIKTSEGNQQVTVLTPIVPSYKISREPAEAFQKYGQAVSDLVDSLKTVDAEENIPSTKPPETSALDAFNAVADAPRELSIPNEIKPEHLVGHSIDAPIEIEDITDDRQGVTIETSKDSDPKAISASNITNDSAVDVADVSDKVKDQLKTAEKVAKVVGACLLVAGGLALFTVSLLAGFTLGPVALIGTIAGGALFSLGIGLAMHAAIGDKDEKDKADADALGDGSTPAGTAVPSFGPAGGATAARIDNPEDEDEGEDDMGLKDLFREDSQPEATDRASKTLVTAPPLPPATPPVGLEDSKPTSKQRDSLMEGLEKSKMFKKARETNNPEAVQPSETQEPPTPTSTENT